MLTFGQPRESTIRHDRAPIPAVAPPAKCPVAPFPTEGPTFLQHFEARVAAGSPPFSGGDEPHFALWVRHRDAAGLDPTVALVAMADVLPPAISGEVKGMRPISSMSWGLDVVQPLPTTDWYLLRSSSDEAADGYSTQTMGCWDETGRLLALGRQTVAIF